MNQNYERRRTSFDQVAALYDRARPGYPTAVADELLALAQMPPDGTILEIGCGTGKATSLFARHGFRMICLDPGKNLTAVATKKLSAFPKVTVETTSFEEWQPTNQFDLIICAQAFHWLQAEIACTKTVSLLKENGIIGLFWNYEPEIEVGIDTIYAEIVPELYKPPPAKPLQSKIDYALDKLAACDRFAVKDVKLYPHQITFDVNAYIDLLQTHSDHRVLPQEQQQRLYRAVADEIARRSGGAITKQYVTAVYIIRPVAPG